MEERTRFIESGRYGRCFAKDGKINQSNCNNDAAGQMELSGYSDEEKDMMVKKHCLCS